MGLGGTGTLSTDYPFVVSSVLLFTSYMGAILPFFNEMQASDDQGACSILLCICYAARLCAVRAEFW